jgi:hypothetical protein
MAAVVESELLLASTCKDSEDMIWSLLFMIILCYPAFEGSRGYIPGFPYRYWANPLQPKPDAQPHPKGKKPECFRRRALFNSAVYLHMQILFLTTKEGGLAVIDMSVLTYRTRLRIQEAPLIDRIQPLDSGCGVPPISASKTPFEMLDAATPCDPLPKFRAWDARQVVGR